MHSKIKGTIGELAVSKYLYELNLPVFLELGDTSKVDIITIVNDKPIRIQVKSFSSKNNRVDIAFKKSGPNYSFKYKETDFDYIATYIPDKNIILWIPSNLLQNKKSITIRFDKTNYSKKYNSYKDFLQFTQL